MILSGQIFDTHFELEFPDDQQLTDVYVGNVYAEWGSAYNDGEKHEQDFNIVQVTVVKQVFPIRLDKPDDQQG